MVTSNFVQKCQKCQPSAGLTLLNKIQEWSKRDISRPPPPPTPMQLSPPPSVMRVKLRDHIWFRPATFQYVLLPKCPVTKIPKKRPDTERLGYKNAQLPIQLPCPWLLQGRCGGWGRDWHLTATLMHHLNTVPEFIDPRFVKTSPKRSYSVIENERFRFVFTKTGSIISGTVLSSPPPPQPTWSEMSTCLQSLLPVSFLHILNY